SCWVNWLVSSGLSGFWFCSCVVSSFRNVLKFPASVALLVTALVAPDVDDELGTGLLAALSGVGRVGPMIAMAQSLVNADLDAAEVRRVESDIEALLPVEHAG